MPKTTDTPDELYAQSVAYQFGVEMRVEKSAGNGARFDELYRRFQNLRIRAANKAAIDAAWNKGFRGKEK